MITEIGHFTLTLATALAIAQIILCATKNPPLQIAQKIQIAQLTLITAAALTLICAFIQSDFSVKIVTLHSHSTKPIPYKIAALWGNHEGSMILWILFLTIFASPAFRKNQENPNLAIKTLAIQAAIITTFLAFTILTSNPFLRLNPAPLQGLGLNPILQDPALAIHPPILYAGYVGSSIIFSYAVALLWTGDTNAIQPCIRAIRSCAQITWALLTAGIALGAWWAYRELGWGGFWFWDPVENAALMPWLLATALIHASMMTERNHTALFLTISLAILTFAFSVFGTFLTRSGILISVHNFAEDPARGAFILAILAAALCGALATLSARWQKLADSRNKTNFAAVSRETAISIHALFLLCGCATIFIGTIYPAILQSLGIERISVGPPYFERAFLPLMIPILILMPIAPYLSWKKADALGALQRLTAAAFAALAAATLVGIFAAPETVIPAIGAGFGIWILAGAISRILDDPPPMRKMRIPMTLAHAGFGIFILGAVATSAAQRQKIANLAPNQQTRFAGYEIVLKNIQPVQEQDHIAWRAEIHVSRNGERIASLAPETRNYIARETITQEAAIATLWNPLADLHAILGTKGKGEARKIQLYLNPLAPLIWLGAILMTAGGFAAAVRKKHRRAP